ncbi:MAG: hypothetical protein ACRD5H_03755, partial [Nitrososphaerales archaeon]
LDAGLCQSHDVRATLVRGPAARQEVRIMGSLWSADNRGKVRGCDQARGNQVCLYSHWANECRKLVYPQQH